MPDTSRLAIVLPAHKGTGSLGSHRAKERGIQRRLKFPSGYVVGTSAAMTTTYRQMESLLGGEIPVLITGETGVGKEWIARILHGSSARSEEPFVALNCAAIPAELAEAELFGIEKGVATGVAERRGRFQQARGGALFLDEIGEMPPALQAKMLRALQEREVYPVGGRSQPFDSWVLAATNANLQQLILTGTFRQDLFYRLAGFSLQIPSLRERREEIPALVAHFLRLTCGLFSKELRGLTEGALRHLMDFSWPGNVRQLEQEIRALVFRCQEGHAIDSSLLPAYIANAPAGECTSKEVDPLDFETRVQCLERRLINEALRLSGGGRSRAARLLGISRNRLARKMKQIGVKDQRE